MVRRVVLVVGVLLGTVAAVFVLGVRSIVLAIVDATFLVALTSDLKSVRLRRSTLTVRPVETVYGGG